MMMIDAAGKVSAFQLQGPQFNPQLCWDSDICATFYA